MGEGKRNIKGSQMVAVFKLPASVQSSNGQKELALEEIDGCKIHDWGIGVLSDGTPFLTQRGLALLCGVENAHIGTISSQWQDVIPKPRISKIRDILSRNGHFLNEAHVIVKVGGRVFYAYREEISLAVIEYYAFDAGQHCQMEARDNFRILATKGFRQAIYESVNYAPSAQVSDDWRPIHDRLSLSYDSAPDGYFIVFKESVEITINLGKEGVFANDSIIPDISIGKCWSEHWKTRNLSAIYGERREYHHNYPEYFPQAASNPQRPKCYPEQALGEFRRWLREEYLRGGKFGQYIRTQVSRGGVPQLKANKALEAYNLPKISSSGKN